MNNEKQYKVTFFSLANDGDEALVRFPYTSVDQLEKHLCHTVKYKGGLFKKIKCLESMCPLCTSSKAVDTSFIRMITYVPQQDGSRKIQAAIWSRPDFIYGEKLRSYIEEYGDMMPTLVFKVKRKGIANDRNTSYDIILGRQDMYPQSAYPIDFSAFEGFSAKGVSYLDLSVDQINNFMVSGELPARTTTQTNTQAQAMSAPRQVVPEATQEQVYGQVSQRQWGKPVPTSVVENFQMPNVTYGSVPMTPAQPMSLVQPTTVPQPTAVQPPVTSPAVAAPQPVVAPQIVQQPQVSVIGNTGTEIGFITEPTTPVASDQLPTSFGAQPQAFAAPSIPGSVPTSTLRYNY